MPDPTPPIAPHLQRVVDERHDLHDKVTKLDAFFPTPIFASLPDAEQKRLRDQSGVMHRYHDILTERLTAVGIG